MNATEAKRRPANLKSILGRNLTQPCECANMLMLQYCPKHKYICCTCLFPQRGNHVVGQINLGFGPYHRRLYAALGIHLSDLSQNHFQVANQKKRKANNISSGRSWRRSKWKATGTKWKSNMRNAWKKEDFTVRKQRRRKTIQEIASSKSKSELEKWLVKTAIGHIRTSAKQCLANKKSTYHQAFLTSNESDQIKAVLSATKEHFDNSGKKTDVCQDFAKKVLAKYPEANEHI